MNQARPPSVGDDGDAQRVIRTVHGRLPRCRRGRGTRSGGSNGCAVYRRERRGTAAALPFCTASDGVRIACETSGTGPPLVKPPNSMTHLEYDWESPVWRHWLRALSREHTLVRFDRRGNGLSDRDTEDLSFDVPNGPVHSREAQDGANFLANAFTAAGIPLR